MASSYEDLIIRQIRAFAAALARIMGLRNAGLIEEARIALDHEYRSLVGDQHDVLRSVDAVTAAHMLNVPGRIAGYARLVHEDAELTVDARAASALRRRSLELALEALQRGYEDEAFPPFVLELASGVDVASLASAHQDQLRLIRSS
jgi:hypothetical protein